MGCKPNKTKRERSEGRCLSFSARLPDDVRGVLGQSICAVKSSSDPFSDFKDSILEMIREVGIRNWEDMEELVYCYLALNSADVHGVIRDAFLSICTSRG